MAPLWHLSLLLFLIPNLLFGEQAEHPRVVIVSIAPYKFFVEAIAGDTVEVMLIIPAGGSPHSYEPTAKQVLAAGKGDAWFCISEPFEARAIQAIQGYSPSLEVVNMLEGTHLIYSHEENHHCLHQGCVDPHVWLSPRMAKEQATIIEQVLSQLYPEHAGRYALALQKFHHKLDALDHEMANILRPLKGHTLLVSHPAYAYLCREYHLHQLSIEFAGKEPSPRQLTETLTRARELDSQVVFVQAQHVSKGARLVAAQLGATVVELDPLREDYLQNMREIARRIAHQ